MNVFKQMQKQQKVGLILVMVILFIDTLLYSLIIPITPYIKETLHPSSIVIGLLYSSYAAALFLATPYFANLSDRIGRKKPLLLGLTGMVLSTLLFAIADSMTFLIIARIIQGVAAAVTWSAALALLADLFAAKERGPVMGIALSGISAGTLLGAPIGGWLLETEGYMSPFIFAAILIIITCLLTFWFLQESQGSSLIESEQSSTRTLLQNPTVLWIIGVILLAETMLCLFEPVLPIYFTAELQSSPIDIGLLFGVMTLAYGIMAPISGHLLNRVGSQVLMIIGLGLTAISLPLLVFSGSFLQATATMSIIGASAGLALSPTLSTLASIVDQSESHAYGAAYGLFSMFHAIGMIAGPLIGGILTDLLSIKEAIFVISIVIFMCTLLLVSTKKKTTSYTASKLNEME